MDREAKDVYRRFTGNTDDFPRRGTRWFRDWFYPLWRDCGQAEVMNRFFRELARHFPRDSGGTYTRRMNWGEYVHFTSGAAAADMSRQAARAFGWPREWPINWSTPARSSPASHIERLARPNRDHAFRFIRSGQPRYALKLARDPIPQPQEG